MGIAELELATCDCPFINRFSDRAHTRLGLRHYCAGNSDNADNRSSSATKPCFAHHHSRHRLRCRWIFSFATDRLAQRGQISRGPALSKYEQRSGERLFR